MNEVIFCTAKISTLSVAGGSIVSAFTTHDLRRRLVTSVRKAGVRKI
jgi:hypothetical protein